MIERYPIQVVIDYTGLNQSDLARTLSAYDGVPAETWRQRIVRCLKGRQAGLPEDLADAVATALGLHPVELWPEWLTGADDRRRARQAEYQRNWRRRNPERAAESSRRWVEKNREIKAANDRWWREHNRDRRRASDRRHHARHADRRNAAKRDKYQSDPDYRARVLEAQRQRDAAKRAARQEAA